MLSVLVFVVSVALSVLKFLIFFGFVILVDAIQFVGGLLLFLVNVSMDMDTVIFVCWAGVQSWFDFVICNLQLQVPVAVDLNWWACGVWLVTLEVLIRVIKCLFVCIHEFMLHQYDEL